MHNTGVITLKLGTVCVASRILNIAAGHVEGGEYLSLLIGPLQQHEVENWCLLLFSKS